MFRSRSSTPELETHRRSRGVIVDDLALRKYANTVRRIFFPVWPEHREWRFVRSPGHPWAWACDFDDKTIYISRVRYVEKDLFRTALIAQIAHARTGVNGAAAWFAEIERAQMIADSIGRERMYRYLGELMNNATAQCLDIRRVDGANRLESYIPDAGAAKKRFSKADTDAVSTFQDSLQLGYVERQIDHAANALARLRKVNRA